MRSIISEAGQSALPIPAVGPHPRVDRIAAATFEQLSAALIFLSVFDAGAFDHAMDVAQSDDDEPGATMPSSGSVPRISRIQDTTSRHA
jgi:hypothetical protein